MVNSPLFHKHNSMEVVVVALVIMVVQLLVVTEVQLLVVMEVQELVVTGVVMVAGTCNNNLTR